MVYDSVTHSKIVLFNLSPQMSTDRSLQIQNFVSFLNFIFDIICRIWYANMICEMIFAIDRYVFHNLKGCLPYSMILGSSSYSESSLWHLSCNLCAFIVFRSFDILFDHINNDHITYIRYIDLILKSILYGPYNMELI